MLTRFRLSILIVCWVFVLGCSNNHKQRQAHCCAELVNVVAMDILTLQKKLHLNPLEPLRIIEGSEEEKDLNKLSLLLDQLDSWHKEKSFLGSKSNIDKINSIISSVTKLPIVNIKLLKGQRALVKTGKNTGEFFYLIKANNNWVIIFRSTWS